MSNFSMLTLDPITKEWHEADWLDNYYGIHHYAVRFPDGSLYDPEIYDLQTKDTPTPPDQPPASRQGADEVHTMLSEIAQSYGGYVAPENKELWAVMFIQIEKDMDALIETEALQILDRLTIQATETKDVTTGAIRQTVGLGYILNERRNLAQRQAELEAGSGEAA